MTAELRRSVCTPFLEKERGEEEGSTPRQGRRSGSYGISIIIVLTPGSHSRAGLHLPLKQTSKPSGRKCCYFYFTQKETKVPRG